MRRRLVRHAFTALCALSLLPCAALCALWVRSYWTADATGVVRQVPAPGSHLIWSVNGTISYRRLANPPGSWAVYRTRGWFYDRQPAEALDGFEIGLAGTRRLLGVAYSDATWGRGPLNGTRETVVRVPYWLMVVGAAALPVAPLLWRRHRRRAARSAAARGLCPTCGYDLRASPGRCPECGAVRSIAL